ncbi:TetR family transcriptional regulator C-terminal domain-containing protein [Actinoplanes sp. LDG1-06]|uniref:TetR family transcriptional regulator C-terminal domain-containing protein n=1 Tax=Paractinoplanes ovalisporus TaxID=2810368 RepID=A0ABS2AT28_9ACTN|nr:TetR/AcrR family transcriptional regulator [Actinoplanes ovalisporus]MBM2622538.1 TetR family transcriptional regulator C-terminal domain-containing protein [Actinoplanes ovalisporus]
MSRTADRPAQGEALSRAVWEVLAHQGLEKLTVRAVAAAAGCTTGLVMHRFPNRRALLLHARELLHEKTRQRVERLEATAATPKEALRAVLRQGLATDAETATESVVWMGFLAAAVSDDELIAMHRRNNRSWRERVERLVASAAPGWPQARTRSVALALITMAEGAAAFAAADPAGYPAADQERMLDTALEAYGLI